MNVLPRWSLAIMGTVAVALTAPSYAYSQTASTATGVPLANYLTSCPILGESQRSQVIDSLLSIHSGQGDAPTSARLRTSDISETEFRLMPAGDSTIILVLERLDIPQRDSYLRAFATDWTPLEAFGQLAQAPRAALEGYISSLAEERVRIRLGQLLHPLYLDLQFAEGDTLTASALLPLTDEDRDNPTLLERAEALPRLSYHWSPSLGQWLLSTKVNN